MYNFYEMSLLLSSLLISSSQHDGLKTEVFVIMGSFSKIVSTSSSKTLLALLSIALLLVPIFLVLPSSSSSDDIVKHSKH